MNQLRSMAEAVAHALTSADVPLGGVVMSLAICSN